MPAYAKTCAVTAVLLAIGAGQACAQVKLGAVLSVTGPASFLGDPEKKTLEMYIDAINAKGGVNGQKLQLVVYDDGADANAARTFATRLVEEDKVVAMVGGTTTGATLASPPPCSAASAVPSARSSVDCCSGCSRHLPPATSPRSTRMRSRSSSS